MTVKIITDSSASIPTPVVEELGITVIPSMIHFGDDVYRDGIDLTTDQFYQRLTTNQVHPTTSTPTLQSFVDAYEKSPSPRSSAPSARSPIRLWAWPKRSPASR
jgi:fatty acid-binding protein DegV